MIQKNCIMCNNIFRRYLSEINKSGGKYCSRRCYELSKVKPDGISKTVNYCLGCGVKTSDYRYKMCIVCSNKKHKTGIIISDYTREKHRESMRNRINPATMPEARAKITLKALLRQGNKDRSIPALNQLFNNYRNSANFRGYEFSLNKEEFKEITNKECFYCGEHPKQRIIKGRKNTKYPSVYIFNGIDRVDNLIGYIISNCVPCCSICNKMKRANTVDIFIKQAIKIAKKHGGSL